MALVAKAFQGKPPRQPANADMSDPILDPLLALIKERGLLDDLQLEEVLQEQSRSGKSYSHRHDHNPHSFDQCCHRLGGDTQQILRSTQEVLADKEMRVGTFYFTKGSMPAAANRLQGVADQYPLYSRADEALWSSAESYRRMGDRFEQQQASAYVRIVRDYPPDLDKPSGNGFRPGSRRGGGAAPPAAPGTGSGPSTTSCRRPVPPWRCPRSLGL